MKRNIFAAANLLPESSGLMNRWVNLTRSSTCLAYTLLYAYARHHIHVCGNIA
jgi:hypothetical protein